MSYPINEPITRTITNTYVSFTINNLTIYPYDQATMVIQCFTIENNIGFSQYLIMSGEDYQKWGGDDDYLIQWINNQLHTIQ